MADDDPVARRIVARRLQQLGALVDVVGDGRAALEAVSGQRYELVLMDCQMPVLDGFAAAAEIRRQEATRNASGHGEGAQRLPIVALTASTLDEARQRCLAAGMDDCLTKPLDAQHLAAMLVRWIPGRIPPPDDDADATPDLPPVLDLAGLPDSDSALSPAYREIFLLFIQEASRRIEALSVAAATDDDAQVGRIAHTLAGSAAGLGAVRLAARCSALERLARDALGPVTSPDESRAPGASHLSDTRQAIDEAISLVRREMHQLEAVLANRLGLTCGP
ncbi:MAG: response regulator [Chloroflexota bacterium]